MHIFSMNAHMTSIGKEAWIVNPHLPLWRPFRHNILGCFYYITTAGTV